MVSLKATGPSAIPEVKRLEPQPVKQSWARLVARLFAGVASIADFLAPVDPRDGSVSTRRVAVLAAAALVLATVPPLLVTHMSREWLVAGCIAYGVMALTTFLLLIASTIKTSEENDYMDGILASHDRAFPAASTVKSISFLLVALVASTWFTASAVCLVEFAWPRSVVLKRPLVGFEWFEYWLCALRTLPLIQYPVRKLLPEIVFSEPVGVTFHDAMWFAGTTWFLAAFVMLYRQRRNIVVTVERFVSTSDPNEVEFLRQRAGRAPHFIKPMILSRIFQDCPPTEKQRLMSLIALQRVFSFPHIFISHADTFPADVRKWGYATAGDFVREHLHDFDETILRKLVGTAGHRILYKKEDREAIAALQGILLPAIVAYGQVVAQRNPEDAGSIQWPVAVDRIVERVIFGQGTHEQVQVAIAAVPYLRMYKFPARFVTELDRCDDETAEVGLAFISKWIESVPSRAKRRMDLPELGKAVRRQLGKSKQRAKIAGPLRQLADVIEKSAAG